MVGKRFSTSCGLAAVLLSSGICSAASGQVTASVAVRTYSAWGPRYGVTVTVPRASAYPPRRALRRAYRYGYVPVVPRLVPVPGAIYRHPYPAWTTPPLGYGWTPPVPNGYAYPPGYQPPTNVPNVPTPANPSTSPQQPMLAPPSNSPPPEAIPASSVE